MNATAKKVRGEAAAKGPPRFPRDAATIRRVHRALHDFTEQFLGELEQAVRDAGSRQLAAARHVGKFLRFLLQRQSSRQPKRTASLETAPAGIVISPDLAKGLQHLDMVALGDRIPAWVNALGGLEPFEGRRFSLKPLIIGKAKKARGKAKAVERDVEADGMAALEREAMPITGDFSQRRGEVRAPAGGRFSKTQTLH